MRGLYEVWLHDEASPQKRMLVTCATSLAEVRPYLREAREQGTAYAVRFPDGTWQALGDPTKVVRRPSGFYFHGKVRQTG